MLILYDKLGLGPFATPCVVCVCVLERTPQNGAGPT